MYFGSYLLDRIYSFRSKFWCSFITRVPKFLDWLNYLNGHRIEDNFTNTWKTWNFVLYKFSYIILINKISSSALNILRTSVVPLCRITVFSTILLVLSWQLFLVSTHVITSRFSPVCCCISDNRWSRVALERDTGRDKSDIPRTVFGTSFRSCLSFAPRNLHRLTGASGGFRLTRVDRRVYFRKK